MSILTEIEDRCNVWHRKMLEMDPPTAVAREYFDLLETVVQMRDFSVDLKEAWAANEAHSI